MGDMPPQVEAYHIAEQIRDEKLGQTPIRLIVINMEAPATTRAGPGAGRPSGRDLLQPGIAAGRVATGDGARAVGELGGGMMLVVEIAERLLARHWRLAVAESATGGLVGHWITRVPGARPTSGAG